MLDTADAVGTGAEPPPTIGFVLPRQRTPKRAEADCTEGVAAGATAVTLPRGRGSGLHVATGPLIPLPRELGGRGLSA